MTQPVLSSRKRPIETWGNILAKKASISTATIGGATLFGLQYYFGQGYANTNWNKTLTYAALGGLAGFTSSIAVSEAQVWSTKSGKANWAVIGGSLGVAIPLIYSAYNWMYNGRASTNLQLTTNATIGALIGGALGTAATYGQKTGLM